MFRYAPHRTVSVNLYQSPLTPHHSPPPKDVLYLYCGPHKPPSPCQFVPFWCVAELGAPPLLLGNVLSASIMSQSRHRWNLPLRCKAAKIDSGRSVA